MICPNQSNRGPLEEEEEEEKEENKCGSLPTADIVGAVGKRPIIKGLILPIKKPPIKSLPIKRLPMKQTSKKGLPNKNI